MNVDKAKQQRRKGIALLLTALCILALPCIIYIRWIETDQPYQRGLALQYALLPTSEYECESISTEDERTTVWFWEKRFSLTYTPNRAVREIAYYYQKTADYLEKHPDSELHDTEIYLLFHLYADEWVQVSGCPAECSVSDESTCIPQHMINLETERLSSIKDMYSLHSLNVTAKTADDVTFFAEWTNLRYLNIYCKDLTQEQTDFLCEHLPECEIWINGVQANPKVQE